MIKIVPAKLENGEIKPVAPLPSPEEIRSVSILLEVQEPPAPDPSRMLKWFGILKDYTGDPKADYRKHLEEKYL